MKKTEYEVGAKVSVVRDKCSMPGCLTALDDLALTYLPNTADGGRLGVSGGEL